MKFNQKLLNRVKEKKSNLCIGLDPEFEKLPGFIQKEKEPLYKFCKEIIETTFEYAVAYKPNIAFFERFGSNGIHQFEKTINFIREKDKEVLIVGDVKRGDLANTSKEYAKYYFDDIKLDSITVSPYMGKDSIEPYLDAGGHIFLLCLTSNPGSKDFQYFKNENNKFFYEIIASEIQSMNKFYPDQLGLVVGATHVGELKKIRDLTPDLSLLIPGYGAQGGKLEDLMPISGHLSLINSSRSIIFSSIEKNFAGKAREASFKISQEMKIYF
ncbi:MAG: orotidine-5'-phosphate decarboxylase [Leptospiraceae bacterium]|nr:orotidine-5'-phosphate decarboxylase [Leptospiraceae bacterium]